LKAGAPLPPQIPQFVSADSTSITIAILPSINNNGSPIYEYQIFRDIGENVDEINIKIEDYDGASETHQITSLTPGKFYKFATKALNSEGESTLSDYITIATSDLPAKPSTITKNTGLSDKTQLHLQWNKVSDA